MRENAYQLLYARLLCALLIHPVTQMHDVIMKKPLSLTEYVLLDLTIEIESQLLRWIHHHQVLHYISHALYFAFLALSFNVRHRVHLFIMYLHSDIYDMTYSKIFKLSATTHAKKTCIFEAIIRTSINYILHT